MQWLAVLWSANVSQSLGTSREVGTISGHSKIIGDESLDRKLKAQPRNLSLY